MTPSPANPVPAPQHPPTPLPAVCKTIVIRGGRAWHGLESEPVAEGRHPRTAAWALAERLWGAGQFTLRELNPWNYEVTVGTPAPQATSRLQDPAVCSTCTHAVASDVQKPQELHP